MGIPKWELLEKYYLDEIALVTKAWNRLHGGEEAEEEVDALAFLGGGGEFVG